MIIALIPLLFFTFITFTWDIRSVLKDLRREQESVTELMEQQLEGILNIMSFISLDVVSDSGFLSGVRNLNYTTGVYEESNNYLQASRRICSYSYTNAEYRIVFMNDKGHYMTNERYNNDYSYAYRLPLNLLEQYSWYPQVQHNYGKTVLLPISDSVLPNVSEPALTVIRAVRDPGKIVGYLAIQVHEESLSPVFEVSLIESFEYLLVYQDMVICRSESFPYKEEKIEDMDVLTEKLEKSYWIQEENQLEYQIRLITVVSKNQRIFDAVKYLIPLLILYISAMIFSIIMIIRFSKLYSKPVTDLTRIMQEITLDNLGKPSERNAYEQYEETRLLYSEFAKMKERLDAMIVKEIALETLQTKQRLHYLQSQINPHFLYNTLNVIGIMGFENNPEAVYDSCLKLSELLRYSISEKNTSVVALGEELKHARQYLDLMKLRFEDRLDYRIEAETSINRQRFLRVILQPFLENIFEHAMNSKHSNLMIRITVKQVPENRWEIKIEDNGIGMQEESLQRMIMEIEKDKNGIYEEVRNSYDVYGIGIKNTILRLSLFFGEKFRYSLRNGEEDGFVITLSGELADIENVLKDV